MVVFGGMGSITGSLIAAIFIGILNTVLQSFSSIRMIIYGLALVGIMIFRPGGLLGTKEFTFSRAVQAAEKERRGERMSLLSVKHLTKTSAVCAPSLTSAWKSTNMS